MSGGRPPLSRAALLLLSAPAAGRGAARLSVALAVPLVLLAIAGVTAPAAASETWVPLFDGRTLAGWEGRTDVFRVEDGAIVAGSRTAPMPRNGSSARWPSTGTSSCGSSSTCRARA